MERLSPIPCTSNTQYLATSPIFTNLSPNLAFPIEDLSLQGERESLGILHPGFDKDCNTFVASEEEEQRLRNILYLEDCDIGRESLGILQINNLNLNFGNEDGTVPDIMLSFSETFSNSTKILDTGFLLSSPSRHLVSTTSQNSILSFNSASLELPSKIFTLTTNEQTTSLFSPTHSLFNNALIATSPDVECRTRIKSQPQLIPSNPVEAGQFFWSTGRPTKSQTFSSNIHSEKLVFSDDKDDMFHESVFIEGNHIAQKIADGSFLNDCYENGPLDSTPQPEWPNDLDESVKSKESVDSKPSIDSVFKAVDKLLPNFNPGREFNKENSKSRSSSSSSKSRDAKEILQNLSDIFNTTHKSDKQKSEGLLLLNNLAEMLNNTQLSKDNVLEDSGHSSIIDNDSDKEKVEADGTKDCNKKDADSLNKFDNSETVESNTKKALSQSFCAAKELPKKLEKRNSSTSSMDMLSNKNRTNSNSSIRSNDSNGSTFGAKIKSKIGTSSLKKGPLRAVIPVKEMKKGSSTPERIEVKTVQIQLKKTSTPKNEPKLKPVAASTPTLDHQNDSNVNASPKWGQRKSFNRSNSLTEPSYKEKLNKNPNGTPTSSKLKRPSFSASSSKEKLNSSPLPVRLQEQQKISRRNSMTEGIIDTQFRMKRSNSVGKETGLMSSLRKVRENILKSPYYNQKSGILVDSNSKVESNAEKKVTFKKSFNSSINMKKPGGKENVC